MSSDPLNLRDEGEWVGEWWLPDEPEHRVPGTLRYGAEDGLKLVLIGAFEDRILSTLADCGIAIDQESRSWDALWGVAGHKEITLLDCVPTGSIRTFGARVNSPERQTVVATSALIGTHVGSENEAAFSLCDVSVEDLGQWAASSVLQGTLGVREGRPDGSGTITVAPVDEPSVEVDGAEFTLAHRHTFPYFDQRRGATVGRVRDTAFVRIKPQDRCSLRDAVGLAQLIQDLVSLATHRAAGAIWLRLRLRAPSSSPAGGRPLEDRDVDVIYQPAHVGDHNGKAVDSNHVFFTCDDIPFEEVIPRWSQVHQRLQAASNMILGLRYAPAQYIENRLLSAVGAAEVLHRGLQIDVPPIPADEFIAIRQAILDQVPEEYQERIKSALRNELTLRDRLRALAARPDAEAITRLVPDVERWARVTTRARNDLAHEGRTPRQSVDELIAVVNVTTAVVIVNLLNELGLPAERQREIVQNHPQLRHTSDHAREWLSAPAADS